MGKEKKLKRSIKDTAWTGIVTAFYCEYCNRTSLVDLPDRERDVLVEQLREQLKKEHINPYRILTPDKINQVQMVNVAARKKEMDGIVRCILKKKRLDTIVNIGCGFDTRAYRFSHFQGKFVDIDLPEVIWWKKKFLSEDLNYRMYGTNKVFGQDFFKILRKYTEGKTLLICEGLFCYFPYSEVVGFVNRFYEAYPDGMLLCDCFLFEETFSFSDAVSRFMLNHPILERYASILKKVKRLPESDGDGKDEKKAVSLTEGLLITEACCTEKKTGENYFISCYEKRSALSEEYRIQLCDQRSAMVSIGAYDAAKRSNEELMELEISLKKTEVSYYPVSLQIEHTDRCNASCIMCSHYFTRNHDTGDCDETLFSILDDILPFVKTVTMQGMGEPFLHPRINELIRHYSMFGIKMNCSTNASIMNGELATLIRDCFYDINISCDACTAETYEKIRKGLRFDKFLDNVRLLREKAPELMMKMAVVIMRQNIRELPGIVDMAADLGFSQLTVMDVTTQSLLENEEDSLKDYPSLAEHYILLAKERAEERGIACSFPDYLFRQKKKETLEQESARMEQVRDHPESFADELYLRYERSGFYQPLIEADTDNFAISGKYHVDGLCRLAASRPFIDRKGNVFLCCNSWMHIIGNIYRDGGFEKVWNGPVMMKIREMFYTGRLPRYCEGCIFLRDEMYAGVRVTDADSQFYAHNYDRKMGELLRKAEECL